MRIILNSRCRFLALLLIGAFLGLAQDRGTIRGTVTDESSAAVPGAVVRYRVQGRGETLRGPKTEDRRPWGYATPVGDFRT